MVTQAVGEALQAASCRVAFAGLVHDLGKLTQRARIFDSDPKREDNQHLYCPFDREGNFFSHLHAADTALAIDQIEKHLPQLLSDDPYPFQPRGSDNVTDSLVNAASAHHKPQTFLQWCIAVADRVASGFERTTWESYNRAKDRNAFRTARMPVRFEHHQAERNAAGRVIGTRPVSKREDELVYRYPIKPLSPDALMPVERAAWAQIDEQRATAEYRALWEILVGTDGSASGVGLIPKSHRAQWPLWLDHFDTLWLTVSHAIPSATAAGVRPDVSLYDHSKAVAALAVALWRHHHDLGRDPEVMVAAQRNRSDWDEKRFLLVQGDFSGIQKFVFGGAAETQKNAARLLRGRSALVSLLTEIAALAVLDALSLPPTSQIIQAAGKFLIVAPNTPDCREAIAKLRSRIDLWFVEQCFGLTGIVIATSEASPNDFVTKDAFAAVQTRLWQDLERAKRQMFGLMDASAPNPIRTSDYANGACPFDGRLPASWTPSVNDPLAHPLSAAAIELGRALADPQRQRLLIFRAEGAPQADGVLPIDVFGYRVLLTGDRESTGNFGEFAKNGSLRRAFDISLPRGKLSAVAWAGHARRPISAYVPLHRHDPAADRRYNHLERAKTGELKTFEHLACDDRIVTDGDNRGQRGASKIVGVEALGVLKGDIDNLGQLFFAETSDHPSFARWAELSRRVNAFFTIRVPALCEAEPSFRDIYTVFAGGDDFFFVGPWRTVRRFAERLRAEFRRYVADNDHIHFSAGYVMAKPGHPIRQLVASVEDELDKAKSSLADGQAKNAFALYGAVIPWPKWQDKVEVAMKRLETHVEDEQLPSAYLYGLLDLSRMAADLSRPENARWRSRLFYQTRRHFERRADLRDKRDERQRRTTSFVQDFGERGIQGNPDGFRIALYDQLYARRD